MHRALVMHLALVILREILGIGAGSKSCTGAPPPMKKKNRCTEPVFFNIKESEFKSPYFFLDFF